MKNPTPQLSFLLSEPPRGFSMIEVLVLRVKKVVPSSGFVLREFKGDEAKALRVNIREACSVLLNRLRNVIKLGDIGGYALLREQVTRFMHRFRDELGTMPEHDVHPLFVLEEEIGKCDTGKLVEAGLLHMEQAIKDTAFLAPVMRKGELVDNEWTIIETALEALSDLIADPSSQANEQLKALRGTYFLKHIPGLIQHLTVKEKQLWQAEKLSNGGLRDLITSLRRELEALDSILSNLVGRLFSHLSQEAAQDLSDRMSKHGENAPLRKARYIFSQIDELACYKRDSEDLKKYRQESDSKNIPYGHMGVVQSGTPCLVPLAQILSMIAPLDESLEPGDKQFLTEAQELLMSIHRDTISSGIALGDNPDARRFFREGGGRLSLELGDDDYQEARGRSLPNRLGDMERDLRKLSKNPRYTVWNQWYRYLHGQLFPGQALSTSQQPAISQGTGAKQLPVTGRGYQPSRSASNKPGSRTGGAFGNPNKQKTRKFF